MQSLNHIVGSDAPNKEEEAYLWGLSRAIAPEGTSEEESVTEQR